MKTLRLFLAIAFCLFYLYTEAQIIHVPGDYPTIQEGIDAAFFQDTVLVAEGEYFENINFNGKRIILASHYIIDHLESHIENTIINGSQSGNPDRGSVVYFEMGEDTTAVLMGFTIKDGTGTYVPTDNIRAGGGIFILNSGAKIINNHIINNEVISNENGTGGGISVGDNINNDNYVIIRDNKIKNNVVEASGFAEGGGLSIYSNGIIENNIIESNEIIAEEETAVGGGIRAVGVIDSRYISCSNNIISNNTVNSGTLELFGGAGGMQAYNCFGNISHNTIQDNIIVSPKDGGVGGGLHFGFCGLAMVVDANYITDNNADEGGIGGGVCLFRSNIQLINNVIARNIALYGSGIQNHFNLDGVTQIVNNTVANNEWEGIYLEEADAVILNTILWNYGNEITLASSNVEVAYSNVFGGWEGEGNINEDPDFIDDTCHIHGLGCVDGGIGEYTMMGILLMAPDHDFDFQARPLCGGFDIGADELLCEGIFNNGNNDFDLAIMPNPSKGKFLVQYKNDHLSDVNLRVINQSGSLVYANSLGKQLPGPQSHILDLSHLPDGIYFIRLQAGNMVETAKVILIK